MKSDKVNAAPTREFIITTMTKDIRIQAAIFDLIDNSINAAEAVANPRRLQGYFASIKINSSEFEISDNCGGLTRFKVWGEAFRIGSSLEYKGGHGVGLKRAFLKFGKDITIISNREDYSCQAKIDVDKWGKNNNWDVSVERIPYERDMYQGLLVNVSNLYPDIIRNFSSNAFFNSLIEEIAIRYRYKIKAGFSIIVNGHSVEEWQVNGNMVAESPFRVINGMTVKIMLYNNVSNKTNGWDIIINGRVILESDKTDKTLWRKRLVITGCSYENFVGEVLIDGENVKKLPIWSTKDGIDTGSKAYEDLLDYMYNFIEQHRDKFRKPEINIQYSRPTELVQSLKEYFEVDTAKEVGERSFDYTYSRNVKKK
jgi:hypothetical protein